MSRLLDLLYLVGLTCAAPLLAWRAWRHGKRPAGFADKFLGRAPECGGAGPVVWWHAVSVGEVNLLAPLLAEARRRRPGWRCVVSTTTLAGFELARRKYPETTVFFCPFDFTWAVRRAVAAVRPTVLVLAELEVWPNLTAAVKAHGGRVAVVNGRLGEKSFRGYRRLAGLLRSTFARLDLAAVQTAAYAERFAALGCRPEVLHVTGNVKFDGISDDRSNPRTCELAALAGIAPGDRVFLAGSTQDPEERLAVETYRALLPTLPDLRLILVPRHPERFEEVARFLEHGGLPFVRRSRLTPGNPPAERILLVDTIGELGAWWGTAHAAFVGGSIHPRGGQNMLEPAAYGAAVCFGPHTHNFRDIVRDLLACGGAEVVADGPALTAFVRKTLLDLPTAERLGEAARRMVRSGAGAARRTIDLLEPLVESTATATVAAPVPPLPLGAG